MNKQSEIRNPKSEIELAVLVGVRLNSQDETSFNNSLDELVQLAITAGAEVVGQLIQLRGYPDVATFIGQGKAEELAKLAGEKEAGLIVFDNDLTGSQVRNLERISGCRVIDRTELILDIFAQRAHTAEAKLQVELAQLSYLLPRLKGKGLLLSRLAGGIGTRGPGETKLEIDRRRLRTRIASLKRAIRQVAKHRTQQRARRKREEIVASLVGYTNAGKSTLLNTLTKSRIKVEDKLFSTLDPTTRRLALPNGRQLLLTDTVGFIQNLPHHLVSAFSATLEETREADFLIHVVDGSSPSCDKQIESVYQVLHELGVEDKPIMTVINKMDLIERPVLRRLLSGGEHVAGISALKGEGIDELLEALTCFPILKSARLRLSLPIKATQLYALICKQGRIISQKYQGEEVIIEAELPLPVVNRLRKSDIYCTPS
ncbi:MAG: GTPase HflX [bacterium]|nr:GTPase HflX [bacterium]